MLRKLVALALTLSACAGSGTSTSQIAVAQVLVPNTTSATVPATSPTTTGSTEPSEPVDTGDPIQDNATAFVAALEEAFAGTSFEGAVLESPEVFLATGEVMCVRLDNGDTVDQILEDYIEGLLSNTSSGADTVSENEAATVAGGVLGATLELMCPQHRQLIED